MEKFFDAISSIIASLITAAIVIFLLTWPVQYLWNSLIPELFHGPTLTFWQTLGLMLLSDVFFKNKTSSTKKEKED